MREFAVQDPNGCYLTFTERAQSADAVDGLVLPRVSRP